MQSLYPDPLSKISLTVSVGQSAKTQIVEQQGIGEELSMNILGWKGDRLACVAQMDTSWPSEESERVRRTTDACMVMRRGWDCDAFTILAEGYMSQEPNLTRSRKLEEAFLDETSGVRECLTVNYIDVDHIELCAVPFRVALGRKVQWGGLLHSEDVSVLRNSEYLTSAQSVLEQDSGLIPEDAETFHLALAVGLHDAAGFFIQYDF